LHQGEDLNRHIFGRFDMNMDENVKRRVDGLKQAMKEYNVKLTVVYSNGKVGISCPNFLYYISGYSPMGPHSLVFIPADGKKELYVSTEAEATQAMEKPMVDSINVTGNIADTISSQINKASTGGQVGFVGLEYLEPGIRHYVESKVGFALKDSNYLFEEIGRGEDEVELMRTIGKMADSMLAAALDVMKPGMTEYELVAEMEYASRLSGADDNFILLDSGRHNTAMHVATDRRLQKGDIILFEISPTRHYQTMQLCRTVVLGAPSKVLLEKYDLLRRALSLSLAAVKPGVMASEVVKIQNKIISDAGYSQYCKPPYMRARGHGFGTGSNPLGFTLDENSNIPLRERMGLVVHPNQYLPETGYLAIGEPIIVTKTGYEKVCTMEPRIYSKNVN
jgi:Xaa-Pro aminopeptidase